MNFRLLWEVASRRVFPRRCAWRDIHVRRVGLRRMRHALERYGNRALLLSATGVYNATKDGGANCHEWPTCDVDDDCMLDLSQEMLDLDALKMATIVCNICHKRLVINKSFGDHYCTCADNKAKIDPKTGWQPFLENTDIIIWRKEEVPGQGLYAYKVYGRYKEVTGEDFLAMHTDTDYWRSWDSTALSVTKLDGQGPVKRHGQYVIHWETQWPRFFANRDYVYVRRYAYLDDVQVSCTPVSHILPYPGQRGWTGCCRPGALLVVVSKSCEHPRAPETGRAVRVKRYWSNLVIKPFTHSEKPGIEFCLTYFDDPGVVIPGSLHAWVAGQACPEFLARMRLAASLYRKQENGPGLDTLDVNVQSIPEHTIPPVPNVIPKVEPEKVESDVNQVEPEHVLDFVVTDNPMPIPRKIIIPICEPIPHKIIIDEKKVKNQISTEEFLCLLTESSPRVQKETVKGKPSNGENVQKKSQVKSAAADSRIQDSSLSSKGDEGEDRGSKRRSLREDQVNNSETTDKPTVQNQSSIGYWRFWPLYYFA